MKIGLHMCGWGETPLPDLLVAARDLGYDGVELAPTWLERHYDMADVDAMLREYGVPTVPTVYAGASNYTDVHALPQAVESARKFSRWIQERGGRNVIFGPVAGKGGMRTDEERKNVHRAYEAVGETVRSEGCMPLYHNHYVVSHEVSKQIWQEDLDGMDWTKWQLCLDTGHLVLALQDPVSVCERWAKSIAWMHCKDVRTTRFQHVAAHQSMSEIVPLFTELGCGVVKFPQILDILRSANYAGWLVVEQDQCVSPRESARCSLEYLKDLKDLLGC